MSKSPRRGALKQAGFTLLEVLVAVGVFTVMAGIAYQGLRNTLLNDEALAQQSSQLRELQFAIALFERDLRAALPRTWRDAEGRPQPALSGQRGGLNLIRAGWDNPTGQARAELEALRYQLDNGRWQRLRWPVLDHSRNTRPVVDELLSDITSARLEFLDRRGWQQQWPLPTQLNSQTDSNWPRAVRLVLQSERWGQVERTIELIDGSAVAAGSLDSPGGEP